MQFLAGVLAVDLLGPYGFEFFRNGLYVATISGALCGLVGCYVVLRSMSYIGHGLSHAIFGGYAVAGLAGVNLFLGAGVWGLVTALAVGGLTRRRPIGSDAAIGVVTTASFALGIAVIKRFGSPGRNADALLFGNILGVSDHDVWIVSGVSLVALVLVLVGYRPLLYSTFDSEVAELSGVNVALIDGLLMTVLAATVLATMSVIGVTLIAATLVVPAVIARMLTDSFSTMLWLATVLGGISGFVGMNLSFHLDLPTGSTIVLVATALFLAAFVAGGRLKNLGRLNPAH